METDFSIKDLPAPVARKIRARAEANHRSLCEELLAIVVAAAADAPDQNAAECCLEDALRRWRGLYPKAAGGAGTAAEILDPRDAGFDASDKGEGEQ